MAFSIAQYEAALDKLDSGTKDLAGKIQQVGPAAEAAANRFYIPDFVADAIIWCANKIIELAQAIWNKIVELLKGAVAPIYMFKYAWEWQDIRGIATTVSSSLEPGALSVDRHWEGEAAAAYVKAIKPQSSAAARIGTVGDKTADSLAICAAAALTFYVALGIILVKFIAAMVAAIAAFGSAVFSWAGAAIVVEEAGVNTGLIVGAVAALGAALGAQAHQMSTLHGLAVDNSAFPGGQWPDATTGQFSDASVKDGDADWSLQG